MAPRTESLGEFEQSVLLAILQLDTAGVDAYGVTVREEIERRTGRMVAVGALYTAFDRLERKGYIQSSLSDPTPERGGRAKRELTVTAQGRAALERSRQFLAKMWEGLAPAPRRGRS